MGLGGWRGPGVGAGMLGIERVEKEDIRSEMLGVRAFVELWESSGAVAEKGAEAADGSGLLGLVEEEDVDFGGKYLFL